MRAKIGRAEKAQSYVADFRKTFEKREFQMKCPDSGITLVIEGTLELKSVSAGTESVSLLSINDLLHKLYAVVKYARSVAIVRMQRKVKTELGMDITSSVPEVSESLIYLDNNKKPAGYDQVVSD